MQPRLGRRLPASRAELIDIVPEGPNFRWNYQLIFATLPGRERLESGGGVLNPGAIGSQDFLTMYDVNWGWILFDYTVTAGPGFSAQIQGFGVDPPGLIPGDGSHATNVTLRYEGPPVAESTVFGGFSIVAPTIDSKLGQYASQRTDNFGLTTNRKIAEIGTIELPTMYVPEPTTWGLMLLACVGVATLRRRHFGRRYGLVALVIALAVSGARKCEAGFSAELIDIVPEGPNFRWNYQLIFATLPGRERLESGGGVLNPGAIGSQDFLTMYDVNHGRGAPFEYTVTAGPGFSAQVHEVGVDPPGLTPLDLSSATNVTLRYEGPPVVESTVFGGFSIVAPINTSRVGQYASQRTDNFGPSVNGKISELGRVETPFDVVVPEPTTCVLLLLACIGVVVLHTRNRFERSSA